MNRILKLLIIISSAMILTGVIIIAVNTSRHNDNNNSAVYLFKKIDFKSLSQKESEYIIFGYDVIDTFSSKTSKDSLTKDQRIDLIKLTKILDDAFGYESYGCLINGILETDLNPNIIHEPYGEVGMYGAWYGTAKRFYNEAKDLMPARLWVLVEFDFRKRTDLLDWENATKMYYIHRWVCDRMYSGDELWTISSYRHGWFLDQWNYGNDKLFPIQFIIKTKFGTILDINPRAYYWTWRNMKLCFSRHDLDSGVKIHKKWKDKEDKLRAEQVEFQRLYSAFRQQEKEIKELRQFKILLEKKISDYDNAEAHKFKVIKSIGGEMKQEGIRKHWHKIKSLCRGWIK